VCLARTLALILFALCILRAQTNNASDFVAAGSVRPETLTSPDLGSVAKTTPLNHLVLYLRPSTERQAAFEETVRSLHNPASPTFHRWLNSTEVTSQLAVPDAHVSVSDSWLKSQNFKVQGLNATHTALYFSGTVAQVETAFRTHIHRFQSADGQVHMANTTMPLIPASLASAVTGIVALHDYAPKSNATPVQVIEPDVLLTSGYQYVGGRDLQVIYDIANTHASGVSGQGQTIAVLETSDMYSTGDWLAYRRTFALAKSFPQGQLITLHPSDPSGLNRCTPPGIETADREATLDSEVVTAAAPSATVVVASCANTFGDTGLNIALSNLLNSPNPPQVVSISYGNSETVMSPAARAEVESLYLQAAAQGISIFVSSGDGGADGYYSDRGTPGTHGISSSGLASTEWNVAVGGTDFEDTYFGVVSDYWQSFNSPTHQSVLSYIPEIPWNGSCGSQLLATYHGFAQTYGINGFCNSPTLPANVSTGLTGSGGPSTCATGSPSISGTTSGTCMGRPKPSWQSGLLGVPNDGARDLPDVALFASAGAWNHGYLICFSDPARSGAPCTDYYGISGGTSASSPLMAGIQALVNQSTGQSWGNPDPVYYALARIEYGPSGNAACDASLGVGVTGGCVFHDITQGDNVVSCTPGTVNCFAPSGSVGVLSLSNTTYQPAYPATVGWDFATGIGSVDAGNLIQHWAAGVAALATSNSANQ